jgi:hypothetical protein
MLAIVSAIVAFRGWPAPTASSEVPSVPLEQSTPRQVAKVDQLQAPSQAQLVAAGSSAATLASAVAARRSTSGLVKQLQGEGPSTVDPRHHMGPATPPPGTGPAQPAQRNSHQNPPPSDPTPAPVSGVTGTVESLLPPLPTPPAASGPGGDTGIAPPRLPRGMQAAYRVLGY